MTKNDPHGPDAVVGRCRQNILHYEDGNTVNHEIIRVHALRALNALQPGDTLPNGNEVCEAFTPIPMLLNCPTCHGEHVDEGEWASRPHKTHRCAHCDWEWRPANVATVGVVSLPLPAEQGEPP